MIAEIETDKAVMDVEAFEDGYLSGPLAEEGAEAPVGEVIGYIADNVGDIAKVAAAAETSPPPKTTDGKAGDGQTPAKAPDEAPAVSAVLAASLGSMHPSTAPRTHRQPVMRPAAEAAAPAAPAASRALQAIEAGPPYHVERASSLREAVARNMIASAAAPTFRVTARLPLDFLVSAAKERQQSLTLVLARACALTIVAHPLFNAAHTPSGLARRERVDIGIAVDSGDGLITPVLRDAAARSMAELAQDWSGLRDKVKSRRLSPADYSGATFYLSDLGMFSVVEVFELDRSHRGVGDPFGRGFPAAGRLLHTRLRSSRCIWRRCGALS